MPWFKSDAGKDAGTIGTGLSRTSFEFGLETPKRVACGRDGSLERWQGRHSGRVGGWRGVRAKNGSLQHSSNIEARGGKSLTRFDERGGATWSTWRLRPPYFFGRSRRWLSDEAL